MASNDEKASPKLNNKVEVHVVEDLYAGDQDAIDPAYYAKAKILNDALQQMGMGRYQYYLFVVAGFGWFADSVWPLITGLILSPVVAELNFSAPFLSLAANIGLLVGVIFWSLGCDIWGRRFSFNMTLLIAGVFGLAAGGGQNLVALASLLAVVGVGVGGNMPVDAAVFLDFVPASHQWLLTMMSIWWCLGQLFVSLLAWPLVANFSCQTTSTAPCKMHDNMGWRYLLFTLGGLTLVLWFVRFFCFQLYESPRYLVGLGKDEEAAEVIRKVAEFNHVECPLDASQLQAVEMDIKGLPSGGKRALFSQSFALGWGNIKALFATRKLAISTTMLILIWAIIGLGSTLYNSFLPFLLTSRGAVFGDGSLNITYRNTFILSVIGVPSALIASWAVEVPYLGRKGTLALSSGLTGAFLFASTTARTSNALLGWNCGYTFFSNIMYGVLYAISPEIFPAKYRGTGNGLVSTATRILGVIAPVIALYANLQTAAPVYIAGGLLMLAGLVALLLPYEPRGKASI